MSYPPQYQPYPQPRRMVTKRGANHGLHIVLSILTGGLWAITGWPIAAMMGRKTVVTTAPQYYPPVPPAQHHTPPPLPPYQNGGYR